MKRLVTLILSCFTLCCTTHAEVAQQQERLDRGAVAIKLGSTKNYITWRFLSTDTENTSFDIYRDGEKINSEPITLSTCYVDEAGSPTSKYTIVTNVNGSTTQSVEIPEVWDNFYKTIKLNRPQAGKTPSGEYYSYTPNDCSVGDADGDGQYELFVKWDPTNSKDNSKTGYTGNVFIDCYKLDGTQLWRVDLGCNIRAGAHYTQFMVYDFDGDGMAEMACKTAPGTIDGKGNAVLMGSDKVTDDYRVKSGGNTGIIITGSEYLTVFSGKTGENLATTAYTPARGKQSEWGKDSYGNRSERYLACVAYLDPAKPSIVMCRGYYQRTALAAYDFDGSKLTLRWLYDSKMVSSGTAYGQGNHNLSVGDVDNDGKDEIIYGACAFDDDGSLMYRTGIGHGDAIHLSDLDPDREGLELFTPHEETSAAYGYEMHDARTGEVIHGVKTGTDIGRGVAADVNKNYRGFEMWAKNEVFDCKGNQIPLSRPSVNFRIYWNGDLYDDLLDGTTITTFANATATKQSNLKELSSYNTSASCNGTKATPNLQADILGDWREEVILWSKTDSASLNIFVSTIPTEYRIPTLMHDHVYRMGIAWQNTAYNQPPHLGYYLPDVYSRDAILIFDNESGKATQTVDMGKPIVPIIMTWEKATGITTSKLPDGLTATIDEEAQMITISGTPTATTAVSFTISTTGGETTAKQTCKININVPDVLSELAIFPFDETSGNSAVNKVQGSAAATAFTPTWVAGKKGNALSFTGSTTERYIAQESYSKLELGYGNFTIELWARAEATSTDNWYLIHKGSHKEDATTGASGKWFGLELKNGTLTFAIDDNATKSTASVSALNYFKGNWTHIVATRDNGALKLYLNGELVAEGVDNTGSISESELLVIGNSNVNFNTPYTGEIDELHIYSGAMNASKVLDIYNGDETPIANIKSDNATFAVRPSAFENRIALTVPQQMNGNVQLKIVSINGQEAFARNYFVDGGATIHIDGLGSLPQGMYIIVLTDGISTHTAKTFKRR